jgi:tight adherence protein B
VKGARFDDVAVTVQRLAVLVGAGIAPVSAWRHAARSAGTSLDDVIASLDSAQDIPARVAAHARAGPPAERTAWAALAAVWAVAAHTGAPLSATLDRAATVLRGLAESAREVEIALAGPTATSRVVLALPAVGVLLGVLLGFDMAQAFASAPGLVCVALAGILISVAVRWNRRLLLWAREIDATPGIGFELVAVALAGGGSVDGAVAVVADACTLSGLELRDDVDAVLEFATAAGVPVIALLRAEADQARREARSAAAMRAARLESRLLLPLGVCVLPAFVLVGVVPIAVAILSSTSLAG